MAEHDPISSNNRFDDYLLRIEAREKASRRRMAIYGLGFLVLITLGFLVVRQIGGSPSLDYRKYSVTELNPQFVAQLFAEDKSAILVATAYGTDTIESSADYVEFRKMLDELDWNPPVAGEENQLLEALPPENTLSPFMVDVAGERRAGEKLIFRIENYDPDISYTLHFGNGYQRNVGQLASYVYRRSGRYRLRLLASQEGGGQSVYTKRLEIKRARPDVAEQTETTPTPQNENPDSEQDTDAAPATALAALESSGDESPEDVPAQNTDGAGERALPRMTTNPESGTLLASREATPPPRVRSTEGQDPAPAAPTTPTTREAVSVNQPLVGAELMPVFPGGTRAMAAYMKRNYRYPRAARNQNIEGQVLIRFVVQPNGRLTDITIIKSIGYGCDEEAIRLVNNMPDWIPGEHKGVKVPVYKTIPITFMLLD